VTKSDIGLENINYSTLYLPIVILPIFFIGFINKVDFSRQREKARKVKLKELFQAKLKFVIYTMFIFAIVAGFGNYSMINYYYGRELSTNELHLLPTVVSIFAAVLSLVLIDRIGRKKILEIGGIGLILLSIILLIAVNLTKQVIPVLVILHLYLFTYVFSFGSVMNILILEYLPTKIRGRGLLVYYLITWIPNYLATTFFLRLSENAVTNSTIIIAIMLIVSLIGYIFARNKLIETNGLKLEDIDNQIITRPNRLSTQSCRGSRHGG
jgi:MFS family permease